ncbi:hypothetical protein [Blastococcus sp. TML/M2B]|nr:hypothetical protein [Blastococcus sp. TML/M2B]
MLRLTVMATHTEAQLRTAGEVVAAAVHAARETHGEGLPAARSVA